MLLPRKACRCQERWPLSLQQLRSRHASGGLTGSARRGGTGSCCSFCVRPAPVRPAQPDPDAIARAQQSAAAVMEKINRVSTAPSP